MEKEMEKYFLCPTCNKLCKEMEMVIEEYPAYNVTIADNGVEYMPIESENGDYFLTKHECGFMSETWSAEDLIVEVNEKSKTIRAVGDYWLEFKKDFEKVAKELKLKVLE